MGNNNPRYAKNTFGFGDTVSENEETINNKAKTMFITATKE